MTPYAYPLTAGQLIGEEGIFSSHYQSNNIAGAAEIRYTFFNIDDLSDTISVTFTFDGVTGENIVSGSKEYSIYPNPSQDIVHITLNELALDEGSVEIYNAQGKLVFVQAFNGTSSLSLNLADLPKGMYLSKLLSKGNYFSSSKFILK